MNTKTTIPISEARKNIFKIAEEVQKPSVYYTLTEKGRPKAVILSAEEFESWLETMEIMSNPRLMKEIETADVDFQKGNYMAFEEFLKQEHADAQRRSQKNCPKRSQKSR